jgi:2-keto-4-pentenoate hydratase/2-oxohepta-3-ene-1,7-dioic acid hydratase in catechol pathway
VAVPAAALPPTLQIQTYVNGEKRQEGSTADLIAGIPRLIEVLSSGMTLQPGDVIATGTPDGVGIGFRPPKFLRSGDIGKGSPVSSLLQCVCEAFTDLSM